MIMCSRHWEAEAVRDGRLTGAEARSFQRHAASCAACSRQVAALDRLGTSLHALPPPPRDALTVRRTRRAILQRLDQEALRPERSRLLRPLAWSASLAAALALGLWLRAPAAPLTSGLVREPHGDPGALPHASAALAREDAPPSSAAPARSLAAVLPPALPVAISPALGTSSRAPSAPPSLLPPSPAAAPLALPSAAPALAPAPPAPPAATASAEEMQASEFEQAMEHFRAGRLGAASVLFDAFVRSHPGDPRAEDAAYLRVVALARSGQREAARQAASGYLARYPGGLRAKEVQNLVR
jgi:hypothetical protein